MTDPRTRSSAPFPEELLSGYLDGALTQQEEQRVRLHLESSPEARTLLAELAALRQASRGTSFGAPEDVQWSERPRSPISAAARWIGGGLLVVWVLVMAGVAIVEGARQPMTGLEAVMALGLVGGVLLLFFSVVWDRLRDLRTDRYRRVQK